MLLLRQYIKHTLIVHSTILSLVQSHTKLFFNLSIEVILIDGGVKKKVCILYTIQHNHNLNVCIKKNNHYKVGKMIMNPVNIKTQGL